MVASVVSIALQTATANDHERPTAWVEGFSMVIAVVVVSTVTAYNDL